MAETARGRVTITLGRSGQVVKKSASVSHVEFTDSLPVAGSKRSVRDRLGSNLDNYSLGGSHVINKRQRGDSYGNTVNACPIGKDDLRYKLLQKKGVDDDDDDEKIIDLRERLSRTGQLPPGSLNKRKHVPDPRDTSILGKVPLLRSADDFPHRNSSRLSCSPWTLDHLRRRSPYRILSSRGLSPPRNGEEPHRRPLSREFDEVARVGAVSHVSKDILDAPRPASTSPFMTKPTFPTASAKPAPLGIPLLSLPPPGPPPSSFVQKGSYMVEEQQTVDSLLHSLGLGKYAILLKAEEVDMTALKQMGENDLKELGIPMGPRKKILLALLPRSKRQQ
ncbi:SAM_1 domain-containing protein [Cephalotus follicularis]|uniref:SAM_1 domain-containing protein n=1 Tax=Cephalotus follicularis TaxID=3775 RepID=A0A1Q3ATR9_CEPFO|nr:SAM_1 domain-containing protein [Cephalotus follicularis]